MELTLGAALFARELSLIQGIVEKRATHQILTNVLLEAVQDRLSLTATDLKNVSLRSTHFSSASSAGHRACPQSVRL